MPFSDEALARLRADAADIIGRYPRARSALLAVNATAPSAEAPSLWYRKKSQLQPAFSRRFTPRATV